MSGPEDSLDLTLDARIDRGPRLLPGFQLRMYLDLPRLEWRTMRGAASTDLTLRPPDSPDNLIAASRWVLDGSFLLSLSQPNWLMLDRAFCSAPLAAPRILPSFADLQAASDEAFFSRLHRSAPLFGAPATDPFAPPRLPIPGPAATPFFKLPDPIPPWSEPPGPRPGAIGDIMSATLDLPIMQSLKTQLSAEATWRLHDMVRYWNNSAVIDKLGLVTLTAPLAAGVIGGVLGADDARHRAFGLLKGAELPIPFIPGLKVKIDDFGKLDPFLLGTPSAQPNRPEAYAASLTLDLTKIAPKFFKGF